MEFAWPSVAEGQGREHHTRGHGAPRSVAEWMQVLPAEYPCIAAAAAHNPHAVASAIGVLSISVLFRAIRDARACTDNWARFSRLGATPQAMTTPSHRSPDGLLCSRCACAPCALT